MVELIKSGIYLLQEDRFIESGKNIYKIGKSEIIYSRLNHYPNGSVVFLVIESFDITKHETELIKIFNEKFIQERYYGLEYFMGDLNIMKEIIINYIKNNNNSNQIKLFKEPLKIERIIKGTKTYIPKEKQELYTKAMIEIIPKEKQELYIKTNTEIISFENNEVIIEQQNGEQINNKLQQNEIDYKNKKHNNETNNKITAIKSTLTNCFDSSICNRCNLDCKYLSNLKRHQARKNQCPILNEDYIDETTSNEDNSNLKNIKEYICNKCNMHFANRSNLRRHDRLNRCKKNLYNNLDKIINSSNNNSNNNNNSNSNNGNSSSNCNNTIIKNTYNMSININVL